MSSVASAVQSSSKAPSQATRLKDVLRANQRQGFMGITKKILEKEKKEKDVPKEVSDEDSKPVWEVELEALKVQISRLMQVERLNADLSGKMQKMQLKHEAEMSEIRSDFIGLRHKADELQEQIKQRDNQIEEQQQTIFELRTGINMTRVQLAYNFVARYSNIDIIVKPEDIFSTLESTMSSSPLAGLTLPGEAGHKRTNFADAKYCSPTRGGVRLTVKRPPALRDWRQLKLQIGQLLAGMCRKDLEPGDIIEHKSNHDDEAVLEFLFRTEKEARSKFQQLEQEIKWNDECSAGSLRGFGLTRISLREMNKKKLTPAGEELLRLNLELFDTENGGDIKKPTESTWERKLQIQQKRDLDFQIQRSALKPLPPPSNLPLLLNPCSLFDYINI